MTFSDLTSLDRNDVLGWLGLEPQQPRGSWILGTLGVFGAGLVAGAAVALFVAPKPGRELREDLRGRFRRGLGTDDGSAPVITREESPRSPSKAY